MHDFFCITHTYMYFTMYARRLHCVYERDDKRTSGLSVYSVYVNLQRQYVRRSREGEMEEEREKNQKQLIFYTQ